jgi:hypothetical protein
MQGLRCPSCGETRWHILPVALNARQECVICGETMVVERRRPGRGRKLAAERRRAAVLGSEGDPGRGLGNGPHGAVPGTPAPA